MKSLEKIYETNATMIYPAHGPLVTDPKRHVGMYISHRKQRESQILDAIKAKGTGISKKEIISVVYPVS